MHITIIAVGRMKEKYLQEGIAEYEKRLRPYLNLQILEINEEKRAAPPLHIRSKRSAMEKESTDPGRNPSRFVHYCPRYKRERLVKREAC